MGETLLEVNELTAGYDQADVIHHVSMQVNQVKSLVYWVLTVLVRRH